MAELGESAFFSNMFDRNVKIETDMLDFGYVTECKDAGTLFSILELLKSGKEGHYPELMKATEDRLVSLLPPDKKKKYLSINLKVSQQEIQDAELDITAWKNAIQRTDEEFIEGKNKDKKKMPPVRGQKESGSLPVDSSKAKKPDDDKEELISRSYRNTKLQYLSKGQIKKLEALRRQLNVEDMSDLQKSHKANLERLKGNEFFKVSEFEKALQCYSNSLAYDDETAAAWANRAMAYIKTEVFDYAEEDCCVALHLDPAYVKAYSRRGLIRFKRGKYIEAVADYKQALALSPDNAELTKLLQSAKAKYKEVEGIDLDEQEQERQKGGFTSIPIHMDEDDDEEDEEENGAPAKSSAGAKFTSIPIQIDDEEDEEEAAAADDSEYVMVSDQNSPQNRGGSWRDRAVKAQVQHCEHLYELLGEFNNRAGGELKLVAEGTLTPWEEPEVAMETVSAAAAVPQTGFVHVAIQADSEDESSGDEQASSDDPSEEAKERDERAAGAPVVGFSRIAIEEDADDSDEDAVQPPADSPAKEEEVLPPAPPSAAELAAAAQERALYFKEAGNRLMLQKKYEDAVQAYNQSLHHDPNYLPSLNNRAQAFVQLKRFAEAVHDCNLVLKQEPGNAKALYRRALSYSHLQQHELARQDVAAILKIDPSNAQAMELLAKLPSPEPTTAVKPASASSSKAVNGAPESMGAKVESLKAQAKTLLAAGKTKEAIALIEKNLEALKESAEVLVDDKLMLLHLLASAYKSSGDLSAMIAVCGDILKVDARNHKALVRRAETLLTLAQKDAKNLSVYRAQIKEDITAALRVDPHSGEVKHLIEELRSLEEDARDSQPENAASSSAAPAKVSPAVAADRKKQSEDLKERGNAAMTQKDYNAAVKLYTESVTLDGSNVAAYNNRALAYLKLSLFHEAERDASQVIHSLANNSDADAQSMTTKALFRRGQARHSLGNSYASSSKLPEAIAGFEAALGDVDEVLRLDTGNKGAETERQKIRTSLKFHQDAQRRKQEEKEREERQRAAKADAGGIRTSAATAGGGGGGKSEFVAVSSKRISRPNIDAAAGAAVADKAAPLSPTPASAASKAEVKPLASPVPSVPPAAASTVTPVKSAEKKSKAADRSPKDGSAIVAPPSVPTKPPKTAYELERVWRGIRNSPELFAAYLSCFKKSTLKKVITETTTPETMSSILSALRDHAPEETVCRILEGLTTVNHFDMMVKLLPGEDLVCLREIFDKYSEGKCAALRVKFKV